MQTKMNTELLNKMVVVVQGMDLEVMPSRLPNLPTQARLDENYSAGMYINLITQKKI